MNVDVTAAEQLDETTETLVYRAAQEGVRNIVRDADASAVTLSVARDSSISGDGQEVLVLRVRDDGRGFETGGTSARSRGSVGLELLAAIVTSHGGTLSVEAAPGEGTELVLKVPVSKEIPPPVAQGQEHEKAGARP